MADTKLVKFMYGTRADYDDKLVTAVDENTLYFLTDTGEIYRGEKNLARGSHYTGLRGLDATGLTETDEQVIARVMATVSVPAVQDDIFVVQTVIADDKTAYTSYVYDGKNWRAMDGNYSADNVYFDEDFVFTKPVGHVTLENGSATVSAKGKNLKEVFASIFSKELDPVVTMPSAKISVPAFGAYEVGTNLTDIAYTTEFEDGAYEFGPEPTGVNAVTYTVTCGDTVLNTPEGTLADVQITDDIDMEVTLRVDYSAGDTPKTNMGNDVVTEGVAIPAGYCTATSGKLSGYRNMFWGTLNTTEYDGAAIRGLQNHMNPADKDVIALEVQEGVCAVVAIPTALGKTIEQVIMPKSFYADVTAEFVKQDAVVSIEGANGYAGVDYDVWMYNPDKMTVGTEFTIVLAQ